MSAVKFQQFVQDLRAGEFDGYLGHMRDLINNRREKLAQLNAATLVPGSHVVVVGNIKPVYLLGHVAKIDRVNQSTVTLTFLKPIFGTGGRSRPITTCRIPMSCIAIATDEQVKGYTASDRNKHQLATRTNRWGDKPLSNEDYELELMAAKAEVQE